MNHFSLNHQFSTSRMQCQSILETCFDIDPGYLRPMLHSSTKSDGMSWFVKNAGGIQATISAWPSPDHPGTGYIGLARAQNFTEIRTWKELLLAAEDYFKANAIFSIFAPVDRSTWFDYRLRETETIGDCVHEWEPAFHPHLQTALNQQGYQPALHFHSTGFESKEFDRALKLSQPSYAAAVQAGLTIRSVNEGDREILLGSIFDITSEVYRDAPCFESIERSAFEDLYRHYNARRDLSLSQILKGPNGEIIGFIYGFPEKDLAVIKTIGVLPIAAKYFKNPRLSASQALLYACLKTAQSQNLAGGVAAMIRDSASSQILEKTQLWAASWTHQYHLFHKRLK